MEKLVNCYYYLFYRFYKLSEAAPSRWWSEWKAGLIMALIVPIIITMGIGYYEIYFKSELLSDNARKIMAYILGGGSGIMNYFIFVHRDQWKSIISRFDKLPVKKQRIGKLLFALFVVWFLGAFIFWIYLMS